MKRMIALVLAVCAACSMMITANAFEPYWVIQYGCYVAAYPHWSDVEADFVDPEEIDPDDQILKLQIDYHKDGMAHIKGYGYTYHEDKLMKVTKLAKRNALRNCYAESYDYSKYPISKGDVVYLTGAKQDGKVGVRVGNDAVFLWMNPKDIGVKRKIKGRCHVYGTPSPKCPKGYIAKGKTVYIDKTHGNMYHIIGVGWVKRWNLIQA